MSPRPCPACGAENQSQDAFCAWCGMALHDRHSPYAQRAQTQGPYGQGRLIAPGNVGEPLLYALLSMCCLPGLGQMILGQGLKGLVILLAAGVAGLFTGGVVSLPISIAAAIDAHQIALKLRSGRPVGEWECF